MSVFSDALILFILGLGQALVGSQAGVKFTQIQNRVEFMMACSSIRFEEEIKSAELN